MLRRHLLQIITPLQGRGDTITRPFFSKMSCYFPDEVLLDMGGVGFGVRVVMFRVIISVQSIVFWALFEISVLTLEPQVGHSKIHDFNTLILDNNLFVVRYNCSIGVSQSW